MALIDKLRAIGDAIREKNGTNELIPLADMPQAILDIVSGGGANYTSITYNNDDTITLIDKDGTEHTIICEYDDDRKLIGVTYDGKEIVIGYDSNDRLNKVGETVVGYEPFELSYADKLYAHFGVDKTTYPYIFITTQLNVTTYALYLNFGSEYSLGGSSITVTGMKKQLSSGNFTVDTTAEEIVNYIINKNPTLAVGTTYHSYAEDYKTFSNIDVSNKCTNFEMLITEAEAVRTTDYTNGFALGLASGGVVEVGIQPLDNTVTFLVDGEPYEKTSVKQGNSINAPATEPASESGTFTGWQLNGANIAFPHPVTQDTTLTASFSSLVQQLYDFYNVDRIEYPYVMINLYSVILDIFFISSYEENDGSLTLNLPLLNGNFRLSSAFSSAPTAEEIVEICKNNILSVTQKTGAINLALSSDSYKYTDIIFIKNHVAQTFPL